MKKIISILLSILMISALCSPAFAKVDNTLSFSQDGTFRILQITDTQDDAHPSPDMLNFVKTAIKNADADLIVFTGDLVEDSRAGDINSDDEPLKEGVVVKDDHDATLKNIEKASDAVLSILQESGIPFAIAMGNNDKKCGISNEEWLAIFSKYSNCLVYDSSDDKDGRIDYNLEIKNTKGETVFNIWMMDSDRGNVNEEQINWYKSASAQIKDKDGNPIPSFVFQHVPVSEIGELFEECSATDEGACLKGSYRLDKTKAEGVANTCYKPGRTSDEFKAWKECGDVIAAYFGHTHVDGYCGKVDGIELGITYGCQMAKPGPYGYRVFTLHEDDILNYDNEVYTYEGSVKSNNAHFVLQENTDYAEYDNFFMKFFASISNLFVNIINALKFLIA